MARFGERLRVSMLIAGRPVSWMARRRKVSTKTVRDWLAMEQADLKARHGVGCAVDLNVSVIWLISGHGSPEPTVANMKLAREAGLLAHA